MKRFVSICLVTSVLMGMFGSTGAAQGRPSSASFEELLPEELFGWADAAEANEETVRSSVYGIVPTLPQPTLESIPPYTNARELRVRGTAPLDAEVTVAYTVDGGGEIVAGKDVAAEPIAGTELGAFAVDVILETEGRYELFAWASKDGETSGPSAAAAMEVDRTPPPGYLWVEWSNVGHDEVELTWEPFSIEDPNHPYEWIPDPTVDYYTLERRSGDDWIVLKETKSDFYYLDVGLPEASFVDYRLSAVDLAGNRSAYTEAYASTQHKSLELVHEAQGWNLGYYRPLVSRDGTTIVFHSNAPGLPDMREDAPWDELGVFVHDAAEDRIRRIGTTTFATERERGDLSAISADGRYIAYLEAERRPEGTEYRLIRYDRIGGGGETVAALNDNGDVSHIAMSYDGTTIAFSTAAALVDGDANETGDVYLAARGDAGWTLERISEGIGEDADASLEVTSWDSAMSGDGRYVAYVATESQTLRERSRLMLYDTALRTTVHVPTLLRGEEVDPARPSLSGDGRSIAYMSHEADGTRIAVLDRIADRARELAFLSEADMVYADGLKLTSDGRYAALIFTSYAGDGPEAEPFRTTYGVIRYDASDVGSYRMIGMLSGHTNDASFSGDGELAVFTTATRDETNVQRLYRVCLSECGGSPPPESISKIVATPMHQVHGQAAMDTSFSIRAIGEAGQQLQAVVEYKRRGESEARTVTFGMEETATKVYTGAFDLLPDTASIERIRVERVGAPAVSAEATGFPMQVAGRIRLEATSEHPERLRGARLDVWSESRRIGNSVYLSSELVAVVDVGAADDYVVQVSDAAGQLWYRDAGAAVEHGAEASRTLHLRAPAYATIAVLGESGEAIRGAQVEFASEDGTPLFGGKTNEAGRIALTGQYYEGDIVSVRVVAPTPYESPAPVTLRLTGGSQTETFRLTNQEMGEMTGVVTWNGTPIPGAIVRIVRYDRLAFPEETATDERGVYRFRALAGYYYLTASREGTPFLRTPVTLYPTLEPGQTTIQPIEMTSRGRGELEVRATVKLVDGGTIRIPFDDWRNAFDYRLSMTSATSTIDWNPYNYGKNGFMIQGSPGEIVHVCIQGAEAGLSGACDDVTLDESRSGTAELVLEEKARIEGSISGLQQTARHSIDVYRYKEDGGRNYIRQYALDGDGSFSLNLPQAGTYALIVNAPTKFRLDAEVAEGQVLRLPPIQLPSGATRFAGKDGNGLGAADFFASVGQHVSLHGRYALSSGDPLFDAHFQLVVPVGSELVPGSVTVSGSPAVAERMPDGRYIVPIGDVSPGEKGTIGYRLQVTESVRETLLTELSIGYSAHRGGAPVLEWLGGAYIRVQAITLEAPDATADGIVRVGGRAPAEETVVVYANGEAIGWTKSTVGGHWFLTAALPEAELSAVWGTPASYRLIARIEGGANDAQSDPAMVVVDETAPMLKKFTMQQKDGRRMSFDPAEGVARFPYVVVPGMPFYFELEFTSPERVSNVKVRMGDSEFPAVRQASGLFQASYRAEMNMGTGIFVTYDTEPKEPAVRRAPSQAEWDRAGSELPPAWRDAEYAIADESVEGPDADTAYTPTYQIQFADEKRSKLKVRLSAKAERLSPSGKAYRDVGYSYNSSTGEVKISAKIAVWAMDVEQRKAFQALANDDRTLDINSDYYAIAFSVAAPSLSDLHMTINTMNGLKSYVNDAIGLTEFADRLLQYQDYIINTECNTTAAKLHMKRLDSLYERASRDLVVKNTLTGLGMVLGVMSGVPLLLGASASVVMTALGDALIAKWEEQFNEIKKDFEEERKWRDDMAEAGALKRCESEEEEEEEEEDDDRPPKKKGHKKKIGDPTWIWDPSGYVYESLPHNRVEGVTATVQQQRPDRPDVWDEWDADWFGQRNPLVTDAQGRYGWDVPEGNWRVLFEKEGYLPARSADLTVLPPHFDVNVPIVSLAPPTLSVNDPLAGSAIRLTFDKYMIVDTVANESVFVYDEEGERVPGAVEAVDPEADASGTMLSRWFRFVPSVPMREGETYRLTALGHVQSYANVAMGAARDFDVTVLPGSTAPREAVERLVVRPGFRQLVVDWTENDAVEYVGLKLYAKRIDGAACGEASEAFELEIEKNVGYAILEQLCRSATYELRLATVGANGAESAGVSSEGATAPESPFVMDSTPPSDVTAAGALGMPTMVWLEWQDPSDADLGGVLVSWKKKGDAKYSPYRYVEKGEQSAYIDELTPSTEYEVRIVATDAYRNASEGVTLHVATSAENEEPAPDTTPPANAANVSVTAAATRLTVAWTDPADADFKELLVQWKKSGDPAFVVSPALVAKGVQRYAIDGLTPDTEYTIRLISIDASGNRSSGTDIVGRTTRRTDGGGGGGGGGGGSGPNPNPNPNPNPIPGDDIAEVLVTGRAQRWSGFDGRIEWSMPARTMPAGETIRVRRLSVPAPLPSGYIAFGSAFELDFGGAAVSKKLSLALKPDLSGRPDFDVRRLGVYRLSEEKPGEWTYLGGRARVGAGTIVVDIDQPGMYAVMAYGRAFGDLANHWSREAVETLVSRHLVHGMSATAFGPDAPLTRAQLTKLLVDMIAAGKERLNAPVGKSPFSDVDPGDWFAPYAAYAKETGLVQGSDGAFRPNDPVTREEAAALFVRALGLEAEAAAAAKSLEGMETKSSESAGTTPPFDDGDQIAPWARGYVEIARLRGLIHGNGGRFEPKATATRAQGAAILLRALEASGRIYDDET